MEITKRTLKKIIKEELNNLSNISEANISEDLLRDTIALLEKHPNQEDNIKAILTLRDMKVTEE